MHEEPAIVEVKDCFAFCPQNVNVDIFNTIVNASSWSTFAKNGAQKLLKRDLLLKNPTEFMTKVHLRASIHDRSAQSVKQHILNNEDLTISEVSKKDQQKRTSIYSFL